MGFFDPFITGVGIDVPRFHITQLYIGDISSPTDICFGDVQNPQKKTFANLCFLKKNGGVPIKGNEVPYPRIIHFERWDFP